jgi:hypothetical protein
MLKGCFTGYDSVSNLEATHLGSVALHAAVAWHKLGSCDAVAADNHSVAWHKLGSCDAAAAGAHCTL